jgi:DNA-binding Lrp family transcriptional regulator
MVTAIVLVKLQAGKEKSALLKIKEIKGVSHVTAVFGRWDLVIDVESIDLSTLTNVVVSKIRKVQGVNTTETLITIAI